MTALLAGVALAGCGSSKHGAPSADGSGASPSSIVNDSTGAPVAGQPTRATTRAAGPAAKKSGAAAGGATSTTYAIVQVPDNPPPAANADHFEQLLNVPATYTRITGGTTEGGEWRLYAHHDDDQDCIRLYHMNSTGGGGGGGSCGQKPPIDGSVSSSAAGRIIYGLVVSSAVRVVVEHAGSSPETLEAVAANGFPTRFYAGVIANQPITRLVAYDRAGKVVAEKDDTAVLNAAPPK